MGARFRLGYFGNFGGKRLADVKAIRMSEMRMSLACKFYSNCRNLHIGQTRRETRSHLTHDFFTYWLAVKSSVC